MNILEEIKKVFHENGIKQNITMDTVFKDLGIDSLDLMDLVIIAEKKLNVRIPDDKLMDINKVSDLVAIIEELKK
ncbi:putative acyl carrier protein [Spiroplasma syrphidicola EA-1]|uniref:Putative acyl carrier protein n=1 Tax=Spiroplasma syrphidicola EA-1 TaxID=1276229 RepID=R4UEZ6_9MOLU|nr:phosphopantetheine-binding protein [Spiroplasma syrphidicola]AGM26499.1 putative acyl carrier protein [Spiroplasma syrphidicola EA-1]